MIKYAGLALASESRIIIKSLFRIINIYTILMLGIKSYYDSYTRKEQD